LFSSFPNNLIWIDFPGQLQGGAGWKSGERKNESGKVERSKTDSGWEGWNIGTNGLLTKFRTCGGKVR